MTTKTPPRLSHLLTVPVLAELLAPSYGTAVNRLPEDVVDDLREGFVGLHVTLCDAVWAALVRARPRSEPAELIEKVAAAMAKKGGPRPNPAAEHIRDAMMPLFAWIDVQLGRAGLRAKEALESPAGAAMLAKAQGVAGDYLAGRLLGETKGDAPKS